MSRLHHSRHYGRQLQPASQLTSPVERPKYLMPAARLTAPPGRLTWVWRSLLLIFLAVGCAKVHHESNSFSSTNSTTRQAATGAQWPEEQKMLFRYQIYNGEAALSNERVLLVFHGLSAGEQRAFHFQENQQAVQIDGPGSSSVSTTCTHNRDNIIFSSEYALGTNTLRFGTQSVRLSRGGRLLLAGDQSVNLSTGRKVVHVKRDKLTVE